MLVNIYDTHKVRPKTWYPFPLNAEKKNFLEWYYLEGMVLEFSEGKTHFSVVSFFGDKELERMKRVLRAEEDGVFTTFIEKEDYFDGL